MTLYAFDGASAFDLDAAKAKGGIVCTVYIRGTPGGYPHADRARVDAIRAKGMGASPNWESTANFFDTCTIAQATWAGLDALAACRALGFPDDGSVACSFSFDYDTNASRFQDAAAKIRAVTAALAGHYKTMIYAEQELLDWLVANGVVGGKHWLMMSTFGQPYNPRSSSVCCVQGHDVDGNWIQSQAVTGSDINTVTDPYAIAAWWPTGSPYAHSTAGGFMAGLTDAQQAEMYQDVRRLSFAFDNLADTPFTERAELTHRLRSLATVASTLVSDADLKAALGALPKTDVAALAAALTPALVTAVQGMGVGLNEAQTEALLVRVLNSAHLTTTVAQ